LFAFGGLTLPYDLQMRHFTTFGGENDMQPLNFDLALSIALINSLFLFVNTFLLVSHGKSPSSINTYFAIVV
jgi:hypothetical protein